MRVKREKVQGVESIYGSEKTEGRKKEDNNGGIRKERKKKDKRRGAV